jgi:hypothetical protein
MTKKNTSTPPKMTAIEKKDGKSGLKCQKKNLNPSEGVVLLVSKSSPLSSTASNVSSQLLMDFLLASSMSSLSAASKTSSLLSTTSNIKKRLVLDSPDNQSQPKKKAHCIKSMTKQEPKLAAYDIDWFNSMATENKCLKHTSDKNLPVTQDRQLTFLLDKYQTSKIKTVFADAIGKVCTAARKALYPLPHHKDKLICSFLELIYGKKSIMIDNSKESFW